MQKVFCYNVASGIINEISFQSDVKESNDPSRDTQINDQHFKSKFGNKN